MAKTAQGKVTLRVPKDERKGPQQPKARKMNAQGPTAQSTGKIIR